MSDYKLYPLSSPLAFRIFQFVDGQKTVVTQLEIKQAIKNNSLSYWLDVLTARGLIVRNTEPRTIPQLYSSANVALDVVRKSFAPELWKGNNGI
ncbi:MAG: helix-turn-helix transcriptional regulator [Thermoguttaceae bacterium]|nr:helix-turn-helix transcriptional regulator [Thermoguttaceae bacterium]